MLKRKKTKSYHGCIFTAFNSETKYVIEENLSLDAEPVKDYLLVRNYPLKKNDFGTKYVFKTINDHFKVGNWKEIGNMYKQE